MEHHRDNAESAVLLSGIAWLAHIVPCQPISDVEIHIQDVVALALLDYRLELFVLAPDVLL